LGRNFGTDTLALDGVSHHAPFNTSMIFVPGSCNATDNERITCLTAPGAGVGHEWNVSVGGQASLSPSTSYALPVINRLAAVNVGSLQNFTTAGGDLIEIEGTNFGCVPSTCALPFSCVARLIK
jgi:hypothetical protein